MKAKTAPDEEELGFQHTGTAEITRPEAMIFESKQMPGGKFPLGCENISVHCALALLSCGGTSSSNHNKSLLEI